MVGVGGGGGGGGCSRDCEWESDMERMKDDKEVRSTVMNLFLVSSVC